MKRRGLLALGTLLVLPRVVRAQKTPTIGLLWNDSVRPSPRIAVLSEALHRKGYVVGRSVHLEDAVALEGYSAMAENAARLARARVDVIVAFGVTATMAAAEATKDIPVLTITGTDPVASGLAKTLSRPGGNISGVWTMSQDLNAKRIELLKELTKATRIGILFAPESSAAKAGSAQTDAAVQRLQLTAVRAEVRAPAEIETAVARLALSRVGGIYVQPSSLLTAHGKRVVDSIAKHAIAAVYGTDGFVAHGALLIYAPSDRKAFDRIANQVDRVLKGARPAEIPIEQASDLELVINLKTARALGITIPQAILQRADRAIE